MKRGTFRWFRLVCLVAGSMVCVRPAPAAPPVLVAEDEGGRVYMAQWNIASNRFDALTYLDKIRGPDQYGANCRAVGMGDFDNDGDNDFVVARAGASNRVYPFLYRNDGINHFTLVDTAGLQGESNDWAMDLCVGDFDNDGNLDFLSGGDGGTVAVFLGDGTGKFRQQLIAGLTSQSRGMDAADFDHDGNLDFVRAAYSSGNLYVHKGRGDGTFASPVLIADVGDDPYGVAAGDFDLDGHPDVIANSGAGGDPYFFKGQGNGTFAAGAYVASLDANRLGGWDAYDYNGDGYLDIVAAHHDLRKVYFYPGSSNVTFAAAVTVGSTTDNAMGISAPPSPPPPGTPQPDVSPPVASAGAGDAVILDGGASIDPFGSIASNRWDFGDGTATAWSNGVPGEVSHAYAAAGRYTARLTVRDIDGWTAVAPATVVITGAPPAVVSTADLVLPESGATLGQWTTQLAATNWISGGGDVRCHWNQSFDVSCDFESGSAGLWRFRAGTWSVSSASPISGACSLRQDDNSLDRGYAWMELPFDGDYVFETDAKFIDGTGQEMMQLVCIPEGWTGSWGEVIFRGRGINDVMIGQWGLDTFTRMLPFTPQANTVYHLTTVCRRGFVEAWINTYYLGGVKMCASAPGRIGLATYRTRAVFDNVRVRSLDGGPREAVQPETSEDFEAGNANLWRVIDGTWSVVGSPVISGAWSYRQSNTGLDRARTQLNVAPSADFLLDADVQIRGGTGEGCILFLWGWNQIYRYEVIFRRGGLNDLLVLRYNTGENTIYNRALPAPLSLNTKYRLAVKRERGWLRFFLDGTDLGRVYDPWVAVNSVGVGCYRSEVVYDNIRVTPQGGDGSAVYTLGVGTNLFSLTASTPWGGATSTTVRVIGQAGSAPTASHGGPYSVDEFTGSALHGGWQVSLNGAGSADSESGIARYEWDLGTDAFDAGRPANGKWVTSGAVTQNGTLKIAGNGYAYTRDRVPRAEGQAVQARIKFSNNDGGVFGFKQDNDSTDWTVWSYGVHAHGAWTYVVQDGSHTALSNVPWQNADWYDIRIEIKASGGARYLWKRPGDSVWTVFYDTTSGTAAYYRRGIWSGGGATVEMDDYRELVSGAAPSYRLYGAGSNSVSLTVWDHALQTHSVTTSATRLVNAGPVANAGADQAQTEANATDSVWTFNFSGAASTDDHGLYRYEWDWNNDGVFDQEGVSVSHTWSAPMTNTIAMRVWDHALQAATDTCVVAVQAGTPPEADTGGPYVLDEFTNGASAGAWAVNLDSSGSSDPESSLVQYIWSLGEDRFDTAANMGQKWYYSSDAKIQGGVLTFDWLAASTAEGHYVFTRDTFQRVRGLRAQTRIRFPVANAHIQFGFKTDTTGSHYNQWVYALHNHDGTLYYIEGGSEGSLGRAITANVWYDWMIELKAGSGAQYYIKLASETQWTLVRDCTYSNATSFRRGYHVYRGSFEADSYTEYAAGASPTYRLYTDHAGTNAVSLAVWDQALHSHTNTTTLVCLYNDPPVARAGADKYGTESNAVEGVWWFTFDGSGSTDDHGIYRYEWDWDYDGTFSPSSDDDAREVHAFPMSRVGTNMIALRVTDHLMQTSTDTVSVVLSASAPPVAEAGSNVAVEVGWPMAFDAGGSTDDVGVARYEWNFGDGKTAAGSNPQHIYRTTGSNTVTLVVYDAAEQASDPDTMVVTVVTSTPPTAAAGGPYTGGAGGPPVYLDGRNSADSADPGVVQGAAKYLWDVDTAVNSDGAGGTDDDVDLVGMTPFTTYSAAGSYTVRLTVVDGAGQSDADTATVTVAANLAPEVICVPLHGNPDSPHLTWSGREATLKGVVRDAGNLTGNLKYRWDYGDGASGTVATVTDKYEIEAKHTYTGPDGKPFTARLMVWDSAGLTGSDEYRLVIRPDNPATRTDVAIDDGLWWLHKDQDHVGAIGRWQSPYAPYYASACASALQALEVNGHRLDGNPREDPYVETVRRGFDDLFARLSTTAIAAQTYGNPDTNGNGIGIGVNGDKTGYESGMVMDAIASSRALLAMAGTGPANVKHRFFVDILTDMIDMYAWGQQDSGGGRGGWRYGWNYGSSDNSACQWGAIGLLAAQDIFWLNIPAFVKSENQIWLAYTYNGTTFGYDDTVADWNWYSTTPSAMVQMAMDGLWTTNAMWQATEDYIANNWPIESDTSKLYYGHYAFVKAMRMAKPRPVVYLEETGLDWYNDPDTGVRQRVVEQQNSGGYWEAYAQQGGGYVLGRDLSTAWAISMLTPSLFVQPPVAVITAPEVWGYAVPIEFSAANSFHIDAAKSIVRYEWDFDGDGQYDLTGLTPDAIWVYPDPRLGEEDPPVEVTVRLRVTDNNEPAQSDTTTWTMTIAEPPHAPYAEAGGPYAGVAGFPVTLDGSGSRDIDPTDYVTEYWWDLNHDDMPDVKTNSPLLRRTYAAAGQYFVGLQVLDNGVMNDGVAMTSGWDYATVNIELNYAPAADAGGPYAGYVDWPVALDGTGSSDANGKALAYAWDLDGDGAADDAAGPFATNSWPVEGTYTVALAVSDTLLSDTGTAVVVVRYDTDGDGLKDGWELKYLGSLTNATATTDFDGDGFPDGDEQGADTDPTKPASRLVIENLWPADPAGIGWVVQWQSVTTRHYNVGRTPDMVHVPFAPVATDVPGQPNVTTYDDTNAVGPGPFFYRVEISR